MTDPRWPYWASGGPGPILEFPDGAYIVRQGDEGDTCFLVIDGEAVVQALVDPDDGRVEIIDIVGSGGVFGELSFLDGRPRSASVRARGPVRALAISRAELDRAAREAPGQAVELMGFLLGVLSARVRESTRLVTEIYETGRRLGMATAAGEVGEVVLARVQRLVPGAGIGLVAYLDGSARRFAPVVGFGLRPSAAVTVAADGPLAAALRRSPEGLVLAATDGLASELAALGGRTRLVCSMLHQDQLVGFVVVTSGDERPSFSPSERVAVSAVANQAAAALAVTSRR